MTRFAAKCRKILVKRSETARMRTRARRAMAAAATVHGGGD